MWKMIAALTAAACGGQQAGRPSKDPSAETAPIKIAEGIERRGSGHYALTVQRTISDGKPPLSVTLDLSPTLEKRTALAGILGLATGEKDLWPNFVVTVETDNLEPGTVRSWYTKFMGYRLKNYPDQQLLAHETLADRELVMRKFTGGARGTYFQTDCAVFVENEGCTVALTGYAGPDDQALLEHYAAACKTMRVMQ